MFLKYKKNLKYKKKIDLYKLSVKKTSLGKISKLSRSNTTLKLYSTYNPYNRLIHYIKKIILFKPFL